VAFQRYPTAIFYAQSTSDVQAAVRCASELGLRVSPAGNRNGFTSMSVPDDAVVIDLSHMRTVSK